MSAPPRFQLLSVAVRALSPAARTGLLRVVPESRPQLRAALAPRRRAPKPTTTAPLAPLMTTSEVGQILRTSARRVRQLCEAREIAFVQLGKRRLLFQPADVADYVRARRRSKGA